ncbi:MAG: hypothetical protein IIB38_09520 [Candidatus Hydrogenedentes bacterium]|nr:hypothetical protein [Candidatus Hydrogenedentota bacterium]
MEMKELRSELHRLGCNVRSCGIHGFVFEPQRSGGLNMENGKLHFWDYCVNAHFDVAVAMETLAELDDGIGYEGVVDALMKLGDVEPPSYCPGGLREQVCGHRERCRVLLLHSKLLTA